MISRYGSEAYRKESGKTLAASYLFLQGSPFIYQGQEIGMTNIRLPDINDYADVSTKHNFHSYHLKETIEKRMEYIYRSSRDSSRTPVQWDSSPNAGFTEAAKPWFAINENYTAVNAGEEEKDPLSILWFYREALALRKREKALLYGKYRLYRPLDRHFFVYERTLDKESFLILCHFGEKGADVRLPRAWRGRRARLVLDTDNRYKTAPEEENLPAAMHFGAYGAAVYKAADPEPRRK